MCFSYSAFVRFKCKVFTIREPRGLALSQENLKLKYQEIDSFLHHWLYYLTEDFSCMVNDVGDYLLYLMLKQVVMVFQKAVTFVTLH